MSNKGFAIIHRKIWDSAVWDTDEPFDHRSAWIDLILMANYEDRQFMTKYGKTMTIRRGQKLVTIRKLSERWHWGKDKVSKFLTSLQLLGMIYQEKTQAGTLLTLRNYSDYQTFLNANRTHSGHTPDANGTESRTQTGTEERNIKKLPNTERKEGDADFLRKGDY